MPRGLLYYGVSGGKESEVLLKAGCPFIQVDRQSAFGMVAQKKKNECGDEFGVVGNVKSLEEVNHHGQRSVRG